MKRCLKVLMSLVVAGFSIGTAVAGELPVVEEHYDEVWVVHEILEDRDWTRSRIYFIHDSKVIAERSKDEQFVIGFNEIRGTRDDLKNKANKKKNKDDDVSYVTVRWDDYGVCHRIVTADTYQEWTVNEGTSSQDTNPWWWMGRRMTDLRAPGLDDNEE